MTAGVISVLSAMGVWINIVVAIFLYHTYKDEMWFGVNHSFLFETVLSRALLVLLVMVPFILAVITIPILIVYGIKGFIRSVYFFIVKGDLFYEQ